MAVRIVCIDPNAVAGSVRVIETGQEAAFGDEFEVEDSDLAERLLEQTDVWARPTTKTAKAAKKESD